jgi:hypothetical protein
MRTSGVDVVYLLGKDSAWEDREIRYSVRSVEKHLKNYRKIFIIGRKPLFFGPEIIEIPCDDIYTNKARNIQRKILRAASEPKIKKEFLLFNDDYFLLKDTDAQDYPYYYKCTLDESLKLNRNNSDYFPHVESTYNLLTSHNLPTLNFDSHYPILYNKEGVKYVCEKYDWNVKAGYIFKSLYCNSLGISGVQIRDCKINHPHIYWDEAVRNLQMFSTGDKAINKSLLLYLNSLFPKPSKYEAGGLIK